MKYANAFTDTFHLGDDILTIASSAKSRKKEHPEAIDATIGALLDEQGKLLAFESIETLRCNLDSQKLRAYPPVDGGKDFQNAVRNWVFKDKRAALESHFHMASLATPGASGALSNILSNYTNEDDIVLIPDIHWSNYQAIIGQTKATYDTYPLFEGDHFNLSGFKEKALDVLNKTGKLVVLLNDPSQNPTGYSLSKTELQSIIAYLDLQAKSHPVILIYDIAYLDYADRDYSLTRNRFEHFLAIESDLLVAVCFSASKTFGVYGLRGGALIGFSRNGSLIEEFSRISLYKARSTWSCPPTTPIHIMNALDQDDTLRMTFIEELKAVRSLLQARAHAFLVEANEVGLKMLPYKEGFFITIPCQHPQKTYQSLMTKDIFVIPLSNAIRVAVAAISLKEIKGLPEIIKAHLQ